MQIESSILSAFFWLMVASGAAFHRKPENATSDSLIRPEWFDLSDTKRVFKSSPNETIAMEEYSEFRIPEAGSSHSSVFLASVVQTLKEYIRQDVFAAEEFHMASSQLDNKIRFVSSMVKNEPYDPYVTAQLFFVRQMFHIMMDSLEYIRTSRNGGSEQHTILARVVDLNLKTFLLFNSRGVPRPSYPNYATIIALYTEYSEFWRVKLASLSTATARIRYAIGFQLDRLDSTLKALRDAMPDDIAQIYSKMSRISQNESN